MHIGSGLRDLDAARVAVDWIVSFAARARSELGWELRTIDLGGGLGVATSPGEHELSIAEFAEGLVAELDRACAQERVPEPALVLEPGRSLTARAGVTFYTVGSVKVSADNTAYVAVDGGMSDNPRPALYDARYTALLAERADEPPARTFTIVGKHCESGDLLIERRRATRTAPRRHPRRPGHRRLHARDELDLQRGAAARRRARGERRGDGDPPARDDRGPARARI